MPRPSVTSRSIDALVIRYLDSGDFKREAKPNTLSKNRAIIELFRSKYGHLPVDRLEFQYLDKIITLERVKQKDGRGGDFAAQKLRKELKRLLRYAVKSGWLASNPVDLVDPIKTKTNGHHSWTEEEIATFRDYWAIGTRQRLTLEIALWTGKRIGDVAKLRPEHIQNNWLVTTDNKTQRSNTIKLSDGLLLALNAMPEKHSYLIACSNGARYSDKGLSQALSEWCDQAKLPHCTANGLRKTMSRKMAESGLTNAEMKAITQHSGAAELAVYTRDANQKELAAKAIERLSANY